MSGVERPIRYRLPRTWLFLGGGFLVYTVLRLVQMTVWLVRAIW